MFQISKARIVNDLDNVTMTTSAPIVTYEPSSVVVNTQPTSPIISKRQQRLDKAIAYFSSLRFVIPLIVACVFAILELHYGINYANQCPIQPKINIFLIVHGSTKLGWILLGIYAYVDAKV